MTTEGAYILPEPLADLLVDALQAEANLRRSQLTSPTLGREGRRAWLQARERECQEAIAAINDGEGVARDLS